MATMTKRRVFKICGALLGLVVLAKVCDCVLPYGLEDRKRIDTVHALLNLRAWRAIGMPASYMYSNDSQVFMVLPTNVVIKGVRVETMFLYRRHWTEFYGHYLVSTNGDVIWLSKKGKPEWMAKGERPVWYK